jgi:hypothetical protein
MEIELENIANKVEPLENKPSEPEEIVKPIAKPKYLVISIDKIETPNGMTGNKWYRYIVGQGGGKIEGLKEGTLAEVTLHAETFSQDLNTRSTGKLVSPGARKQLITPAKPPAPAVEDVKKDV